MWIIIHMFKSVICDSISNDIYEFLKSVLHGFSLKSFFFIKTNIYSRIMKLIHIKDY